LTAGAHKAAGRPAECMRLRFRMWTARWRFLPQFLVIGAQKSGTTSLFKFICQHYQVRPAIRKEVHFFDGGLEPAVDNFQKGPRWYRAHFPLKGGRRRSITGEASPLYLFNPLAPQRIRRLIPDAKLIAVIRDPVDRAVSHYFHEVRKERETLPMLQAFKAEEERLAPVLNTADYKHDRFLHASYKKRGIYWEQLERYFRCFPKNQLLVLESESFFSRPRAILKQVFAFLRIDAGFSITDTRPRNVRPEKPEVEAGVYDYLAAFFRPHNQALSALVRRRFNWR